MKSLHLFLPVALLGMLLTQGCETPSHTQMVSDALPRPGAKVVLGDLNNQTGQPFEFDVPTEFRNALTRQLGERGLLVAATSSPGDFILNLDIVAYHEGSAFKRWLVPGWGCTVLAVQGHLLERDTQKPVAQIQDERTVAIGGLYTIGAAHTILTEVARDLAQDLQLRITKGGEFILEAKSRLNDVPVTQPAADAPTVCLTEVSDARLETGRVGERFAAFGVSMGDIYFARSVPDYLRENLELELTAAGCRLSSTNAKAKLQCAVSQFWVTTKTTPLYWDIVATIKITVTDAARPAVPPRDLTATASRRTYIWPSASICEQALQESLGEVMKQFRDSGVWR